jgi:hypothetical protein
VRAVPLLAIVVLAAAAACGASAAANPPIRFGVTGGNLAGYKVTIQPGGSVRIKGTLTTAADKITPAQVRRLRREIRHAHLTSRHCPGVLPDFASHFIELGGRTVTVHGSCEARFQRVWNDLVRTTGLGSA